MKFLEHKKSGTNMDAAFLFENSSTIA
jgi:hypothetical protein